MSDKLEALKASARGIARLLGDIASFDSWDIDGDIVDIRFEDENGCDTGADVSITETADKASQAIGELLAALEEKDQSIAELNVKLFDQSILLDAAISRAEASGRREDHLKATVDVLSAKNAELETGHGEAAKQINSWRNLAKQNIAEREKDIAALDVARQQLANAEHQLHLADLANFNLRASRKAQFRKRREAEQRLALVREQRDNELRTNAELEQRLQQPIKLPNKNDDEFWFGSTFQVEKFDRAVERAIIAAGFKFKGE